MTLLRQAGVSVRHFLRWLWRYGLRFLFLTLFILAFLPHSTVPTNDIWLNVASAISGKQFDFIGWEVSAIAAKTQQTLFGVHPFMDETARSQLVRDYMTDLARAQSLE